MLCQHSKGADQGNELAGNWSGNARPQWSQFAGIQCPDYSLSCSFSFFSTKFCKQKQFYCFQLLCYEGVPLFHA